MNLRVVLTNVLHAPTREEIHTFDRSAGEKYFEGFDLEWAGYIILTDTCRLSAQWMLETDDVEGLLEHTQHTEFAGYEVAIFDTDDNNYEETKLL